MAYRRDGITVFNPFCLVSTFFGAGLLPKAPGTWGSLAALPFAWAMLELGGNRLLLAAAALCFVIGWGCAREYVWRTGIQDPPEVVIDEVAGQWLVLVAATPDPISFAVAFVLFRLFDIVKPWPIRVLERRFDGGLGVMIDDIAAAIMALAGMAVFNHVWPGLAG